MNRIFSAIALSLLLISACIVYLVSSGISLRAAPIIQPSLMDINGDNVAKALNIRLFQELQNSRYVIWGALPETEESARLINKAAEEYEKLFHKPVQFIRNAEGASAEYLRACAKPCWLTVPSTKANQLSTNIFIKDSILSLAEPFFTITIVPFTPDAEVPDGCDGEKRLSLRCFVPISVRNVRRKIKAPEKRHFFLNKYYENDFFLFIQQPT